MNRINRYLTIFVLAILAAALGQSARASVNVLTSADAGGGFSPDIPIYAYHFYGHNIGPTDAAIGAASYTIQGVTFQPFDMEPPSDFGPSTHGNLTFMSFSAPGSYEGDSPVSLGAGTNNANLQSMLINQSWYSDEVFAAQYNPIRVIAAGLTPGADYQIDVLAYGDTTYPASFSFIGAGSPIVESTFNENSGSYYDVVEDVIADGSGNVEVDLISPDAVNTEYPRIGAVSVSFVPEPCTAAIAGVGGLILLGKRRRIAA